MKKNLIIALVSILTTSATAMAAQPTDEQINRYYAALSGQALENSTEIKYKRNDQFDGDLELLETLRAANPDLSPEDFMSLFMKTRLGAITEAAEESK